MPTHIQLDYRRKPSTLRFMANALRPSPGFAADRRLPSIAARWSRHRVGARGLDAFLRLTGLPAAPQLPLLYPHVIGFPLQMVILTHPRFPIPIWRVLQVRNHLLQHRPLPTDAEFELGTRIAGRRVLDKGAEVDLHTEVRAGGALAWESLNTFYFRGRFGTADDASPLAVAPAVGDRQVDAWRMPDGGGWRFGGLTGDYNGIHTVGWYARRFGFPRPFFHSQRVLGHCLARLPAPDAAAPQRLDAWLKGPVFYGAEVELRAGSGGDGTAFALNAKGDARPAIIGRLRAAAPGRRLLDELN